MPPSSPGGGPEDLHSYDRIIVAFSAGKDSLACFLTLLERGVDPEKIELHHHLVDGREGVFMDWPVTEAYSEAVARTFGVRHSCSWKVGGFRREMFREDAPTAPIMVPDADSNVCHGGDGPLGTRQKFPQLASTLQTRWCSAYLKVDVFARWLNNDPRFLESRTLVITGERAEESANRARYQTFFPHPCDRRDSPKLQRHIDHWRPVHSWSEKDVWAIIERWQVLAHPCYYIGGWSRASCRFCIFSGKHHWASLRQIAPVEFAEIAKCEREFGVTIHRSKSIAQLADEGTPFEMDPYWVSIANATTFNLPIIRNQWVLPAGAFKEGMCGPT